MTSQLSFTLSAPPITVLWTRPRYYPVRVRMDRIDQKILIELQQDATVSLA